MGYFIRFVYDFYCVYCIYLSLVVLLEQANIWPTLASVAVWLNFLHHWEQSQQEEELTRLARIATNKQRVERGEQELSATVLCR